MPSKVYQSIKDSVPSNLQLNVKATVQNHIGKENAITKEELSKKVFGKFTDTTDRQIRDAITDLVSDHDEPIVATNESVGFYYAKTPSEIDANIAELESRRQRLSARIEGLRRAKWRVFHEVENPLQQRLI